MLDNIDSSWFTCPIIPAERALKPKKGCVDDVALVVAGSGVEWLRLALAVAWLMSLKDSEIHKLKYGSVIGSVHSDIDWNDCECAAACVIGEVLQSPFTPIFILPWHHHNTILHHQHDVIITISSCTTPTSSSCHHSTCSTMISFYLVCSHLTSLWYHIVPLWHHYPYVLCSYINPIYLLVKTQVWSYSNIPEF